MLDGGGLGMFEPSIKTPVIGDVSASVSLKGFVGSILGTTTGLPVTTSSASISSSVPISSSTSTACSSSKAEGGSLSVCISVLITPLSLLPTFPASISLKICDVLLNPEVRMAWPIELKNSTILLKMPSALGGICTLKFLALYISAMASSTKSSSIASSPRVSIALGSLTLFIATALS